MRDAAIFLATRILLTVAWAATLVAFVVGQLQCLALWLALQPARASVWLSRRYSTAWLAARESERFGRIDEERRRHEF